MPITRTSGVQTALDKDFFVDVNVRYYRIEFSGVDFTSEVDVPNGASELVIQLIKPMAYRIKVQGGHTFIFAIIEGADAGDDDMDGVNLKAETDLLLQTQIRAMGSSVGPNNLDLTGCQVFFKSLQ